MTSPQSRFHLQSIPRQLSKKICERDCGRGLFSSDVADVQAMLSSGRVAPGTLMECLADVEGSGAMSLACRLAGCLQHDSRGSVVIVDSSGDFSPLGAVSLGLILEQTVMVRPATQRDELWAVEQSLRCPGVAVVVYRLGSVDARIGRRLMLAAEVGNTVGLFVRPASVQQHSSFASLRLHIQPAPIDEDDPAIRRKLAVKTLYVRGGGFQESVTYVEIGQSPEAA